MMYLSLEILAFRVRIRNKSFVYSMADEDTNNIKCSIFWGEGEVGSCQNVSGKVFELAY